MKPFFVEIEENESLPIAPMIDVVFLLLIFFMCVSTFSRVEKEFSISLPETKTGARRVEDTGQIIVNVSEDGGISVDQQVYTVESLGRFLEETYTSNRGIEVVIRGDRNAKHGKVMSVLDTCMEIGISKVRIRSRRESP